MRALSTAFALSLALTGAALADNTDHLQTVIDEAVDNRNAEPIAVLTAEGATVLVPVNTDDGWSDDRGATHPAYRFPFKADGGE